MPKENSRSRKKSGTKVTEEQTLTRVAEWAKNELTSIRKSSKIPVCVQLQNGDYLVGTQRVVKRSQIWWQVNDLDFGDKRSAIFYCALQHLGKQDEANEIYNVDLLISDIEIDKARYRFRLDAAHLAGDSFKIDLYSSRHSEAKRRLMQAKQELAKIISNAKYHYGIL